MIYAGAIEVDTTTAILILLVVLMPLFLAVIGLVLVAVGVRAHQRSAGSASRSGLPLIVTGVAFVVPAVLIYGATFT